MNPAKISESGVIGTDGKLRLPMDRINAFCSANKGRRVVVRFEAAAPGSSAALLGYYYNYVVPSIVSALREQGTRKSDDATDRFLIEQYPGDFGLEPGVYVSVARQLDQRQMLDFLEWLKQYAAENLYVYIEDPKTI